MGATRRRWEAVQDTGPRLLGAQCLLQSRLLAPATPAASISPVFAALPPLASPLPSHSPAPPLPPVQALGGLTLSCSSPLRTLFHLFKPGLLLGYIQVCVLG